MPVNLNGVFLTREKFIEEEITDATAISSDVKSGKVFYNNSGKQTGSLSLTGTATPADVISGKTFYGSSFTRQTGTYQPPDLGDYITDATAVASDVMKGKVFYNNYGRQTGSFQFSGTARASDVLQGKTFYSTGSSKITGTLKEKVYSDFVDDATATAADVASGKVFYNNSGRQVGTKSDGSKVLSFNASSKGSGFDSYSNSSAIVYNLNSSNGAVRTTTGMSNCMYLNKYEYNEIIPGSASGAILAARFNGNNSGIVTPIGEYSQDFLNVVAVIGTNSNNYSLVMIFPSATPFKCYLYATIDMQIELFYLE